MACPFLIIPQLQPTSPVKGHPKMIGYTAVDFGVNKQRLTPAVVVKFVQLANIWRYMHTALKHEYPWSDDTDSPESPSPLATCTKYTVFIQALRLSQDRMS